MRVVFVASDSPKPATAVLFADDTTKSLRDPFTREHLPVTAGRVSIVVPPRGIRMFVVER